MINWLTCCWISSSFIDHVWWLFLFKDCLGSLKVSEKMFILLRLFQKFGTRALRDYITFAIFTHVIWNDTGKCQCQRSRYLMVVAKFVCGVCLLTIVSMFYCRVHDLTLYLSSTVPSFFVWFLFNNWSYRKINRRYCLQTTKLGVHFKGKIRTCWFLEHFVILSFLS